MIFCLVLVRGVTVFMRMRDATVSLKTRLNKVIVINRCISKSCIMAF